MMDIKQFYKELGRLLYSVAMSDGKIQKEEIKTLHEIITKEFAIFESSFDSSGMNKAFYADFEFADYAQHNINIQEAHDSFITFLKDNINYIDPRLLTKSVESVEKMAGAFKLINKKEREMINEIKKEIADIIV